ncbi:hypothetical protein A6V36_16600 [Paraburkholderia ginsengiterrae]|uniref:DUF1254 domain-containing protein n=1 Tax=Paraburkholderia ginsengiterrae TaxID=1462993 RepID=A0A1A9N9M9_9BURK|nr:DUF1214 domain-containing protein [Paraburkholderia ginsengiterrae]OAJ51639.1 hypothetical protein A6V36_16600 [Paraburkholderia ginsengiterrae]OAJ61826.1 hypothetical protein A6V37_24355 [Paraburkholderia ginsengiterrae]
MKIMHNYVFARRVFASLVVASSVTTTSMPGATAAVPQEQTAVVAKPDEQTVSDTFVYVLGRLLVIRQEQMDRKAPAFAWNSIKYNPLGSADFVNPNFDVAYLEAWIATDDHAGVLLEVPEIKGRYYTAQILDEWGEVIANINERTFPSKPYGKFALVKPGSNVAIPPDAARIELHSSKAKLLARVEIKGDRDGALALQKQFKLTPLGNIAVSTAPNVPDFDNAKLLGAEAFDNLDAVFSSALDVSPVAARMQQQARYVASYAASSPQARAEIDRLLRDKIDPDFVQNALARSGPIHNHWVGGAPTGNYGSNYSLRTVANYAGIWANVTDEVIYFVPAGDANNQPLDGSKSYIMRFPADRLPSSVVNGYWSVILVGVPDYRVVPNSLNRFNFNSYSNLTKERDGSLTIAIGPKPVKGVPETNWLPTDPGKRLSLTFRTYVPKDIVKQGKWAPPAVTEVQ